MTLLKVAELRYWHPIFFPQIKNMFSLGTHRIREVMWYDLKLAERSAYPNNKNMSHVFSAKSSYAIYMLCIWK